MCNWVEQGDLATVPGSGPHHREGSAGRPAAQVPKFVHNKLRVFDRLVRNGQMSPSVQALSDLVVLACRIAQSPADSSLHAEWQVAKELIAKRSRRPCPRSMRFPS